MSGNNIVISVYKIYKIKFTKIDNKICQSYSVIFFRILKICKLYCLSKDACAVAAVFLIANFLTRSDVKKLYLEEMIMWCLKVMLF